MKRVQLYDYVNILIIINAQINVGVSFIFLTSIRPYPTKTNIPQWKRIFRIVDSKLMIFSFYV